MKSGSVYLFADDVTISCIEKKADEAVAQLGKALDKLCDWCILNRLTPVDNMDDGRTRRLFLPTLGHFMHW